MNDLERYVNRRFAKFKHNKEIQELRDEVLVNLQARIDDEMAQGKPYQAAFDLAVESLGNVDLLIEGHQEVARNRFRRGAAQLAVLYSLIPWVITIPLRFFHSGVLANTGWTLVLVITGVVYLVLLWLTRSDETTRVINVRKLRNVTKVVWVLWGIYVILSTCFTLGTWFASDIWFHRSIQMTGPYVFASFVVSVVLPFVSVFIPLYFVRVQRLVQEQEGFV